MIGYGARSHTVTAREAPVYRGFLLARVGSDAVVVTAVATITGTGWYVLLGTWVLLGIGTSLVNTPSSRLLADASTLANRNLVYTAQFALSHACFLVTYPIAGWLGAANLTGAAVVLLILAVVAGAVAVTFSRTRRLSENTPAPI